MHVDWRWIKQRPHFIAEGLSDYYHVNVIYLYSKRYLLNFNVNIINKRSFTIFPAFRLPFYQNKWIYKLNRTYMRFYIKFFIKKYNPDYLWITFPQLYDYIPQNIDCKLIYDCMDDATGFDYPENFKFNISESDKRLVKDANIVFTSSNYLYDKLHDNYQCEDKLYLIRNAFDGKIVDETTFGEKKHHNIYKIGYVGTISSWFDFDALKFTLEKFKNIEYNLIGPIEKNVLKYNHARLNYLGPVNHKELFNYVKHFDCLIMPFKLSDLVKSVDPTKLYEYINYNKPIISVYYEELEYFSQFLYFYENNEDLEDIIKNLIQNGFQTKYTDFKRLEFLNNNSWNDRLSKIREHLEN